MREEIPTVDVHVVALEWDLEKWTKLKKADIAGDWERWTNELQKRS